MKLFEQTIPFLKFLLYLGIMYYVGILKGLALCYICHKIYNFIMLKLFKFSPLAPSDLTFVWNSHEETYNMSCVLQLETLDKEAVKNLIIERGLKKFKKLRSRLVYKFYEWWWMEVPLEESLQAIEIMDHTNININSKEDLVKFGSQIIAKRFDLEKELPYKVIIYQNEKNHPTYQNIVVFKFDHSFTDGIGLISLVSALSDNYNSNVFPHTLTRKMGWYNTIMALLTIPYLIVYPIYRNLIYLKSGDTPFKSDKPLTGIPNISVSDMIDFNTYSKLSKKLKITFNDLMMSIFSSALKKYCRDNYKRIPEKIIGIIPIANRTIPHNLDEIQITNNSSGAACELKLIDDPIKECHIISREFSRNVRNIPLIKLIKMMNDFIFVFLPHYIATYIVRKAGKNFDVTFSNVPGPRSTLLYAGCKINEMIPIFTTGFHLAFIAIFSYGGHFRFTIATDQVLGIKSELILEYVMRELDIITATLDDEHKKIN